MKTLIILLTGLAVSAGLLACSNAGGFVEAKSGTRKAPFSETTNSAPPARSDWRLGSPATYKNLTLFPVISDEPMKTAEFITLDEGLRAGSIIITELGDGRSNGASRQRGSEGAEVNRLALTNKSGKALVLIAGEMLLGGKQDRIVGHDCIIESAATPVPIDVFCVEHGRWSGDVAFGQSRARASDSGLGSGEGSSSVAADAPMALPNVREKAQAKKDQTQVWSAVSETVTVTASASETVDLNSVYQNKRVNKQASQYERAFKDKLSTGNIVGVVAAIGGKIISADVFASHSLFQAYWPKMLKSYALEAVSATKLTAGQVSRSDAEAFLARVQGNGASNGHEGVYKLDENQSTSDASFELEYVKQAPKLIHFNRVAKR